MLIQSTTRTHRPHLKTPQGLITLALRYVLLTLGVFVMMLPFLWALSVGISKDPTAVVHLADAAFNAAEGDFSQLGSALWPEEFTFYWFERAFTDFPVLSYLNNSAILSSITVILTLALSIPAAFAFAQMEFYGRNVIFIILSIFV